MPHGFATKTRSAYGSGLPADMVAKADDATTLAGYGITDAASDSELAAVKVGQKFYIRDAQGTPHYWQVTVSVAGVLTTADAGTSEPTDGIVIYA